ncbi:MAG: TonB-dependent receptor plug domain-containing protein [Desulfobulbaceae bacterium]|nr:TonB-dependent receptor plug domain-containing protein [Desulfobulbaceae bacterium]
MQISEEKSIYAPLIRNFRFEKNIMRIFYLHISTLLAFLLWPVTAFATDTSLLFVGEDISLLTIASRRAESPESAPAIAQVVTREEIERNGVMTLSETLSRLPGFHMSPSNPGTTPYLRGLPNSILFLYDSVHLTSDAAKSVNPLDLDLSLDHIQRIEVIRGPGSVLWGPDAFAGIVNIVPRRGRDIDGFEFKAFGGSTDNEKRGSLSWGKNAGLWEAFVSISASNLEARNSKYNVVKLTGSDGRPVPPDERMGSDSVDHSKYMEAVFNFAWQDYLRFSGRWSDTQKEYILEDRDKNLTWPAYTDKPMWYLRLEAEKKFESSALRLNGYYNQLDEKTRELDLPPLDRESHVSYTELLYDRELWGANGMLTLGTSYRHNQINGAEITKAYPPDFFEANNILFLPNAQQKDFSTSMFSAFGQLKRHWNHFDTWCGLRLTDHDEYDVELSPNVGLIWSPSLSWNLKMLYGTSYRTPYARQLVGRDDLEPEEIQNLSASLIWRATPAVRFTTTTFWDQIKHQTTQDPYYGGLSDPTTQDLYGLEFEVLWKIASNVRFQANATVFTHTGDEETYTYYAYTLDDGEWILKPWISWDIPFETGPKSMMNASLNWSPTINTKISINMKYESSWDYTYDKGSQKRNVPSNLLIDATLTVSDLWQPGIDLQLSIKNILDNRFDARGTYGPIDSTPLNAYLGIKWRF